MSAPPNDTFALPSVTAENTSGAYERYSSLSGWRLGAFLALGGAVSIFIGNSNLTILVWRSPRFHTQGGVGTLFEGNCATTRDLNVVAQLLVNILSTSLLSASNYCMQILCSPNRGEIDRAHTQRLWLHIGIPSIHNLRFFGGERSFLWTLLLISSMPLHLFYNSVFFTNLQANKYFALPTMDEWLFGGTYDPTNVMGFDNNASFEEAMDAYRPILDENIVLNNGTAIRRYRNASTEECFRSYDTQYPSGLGNVYLSQEAPAAWHDSHLWSHGEHNFTGELSWHVENDSVALEFRNEAKYVFKTAMPFQGDPRVYPSGRWRCSPSENSTCDFPGTSLGWRPYGSSIRYCLIEQVEERCKLQFSLSFMSIVLVSNLVTIVCIGRLLLCHRSHCAIVTLGDAVASFLEYTDVHTEGRCLPSEVQIDRAYNSRTFAAPKGEVIWTSEHSKKELENRPRAYKPERLPWSSASSYGTWFATYIFVAVAIVLGIWAIFLSLDGLPRTLEELWNIDFGSVDGVNIFSTQMSHLRGVLTANTPQLILSYLYVAFNRLLTGMLLGKEWSSYLHERKALRVTAPVGQQRSSYWLSVPYRYGIPTIIVSALFQWLVSQSLFLVQITVTETYKNGPRRIVPTDHISTCGFSPVAIILTTLLASTIAVVGILMGRLRYPAGMPLASSCSAVMSAACHSPAQDVDAHLLPIQWGAVCHGSVENEGWDLQIGHCCFSSLPVEEPIPGRLYA